MRIGSGSASRLGYVDRTPVMQALAYEADGVGPHGETVRAQLTNGATLKAYVESVFLLVDRRSAAGAVGDIYARVRYTPSGGSAATVGMCFVHDNTAEAQRMLALPVQGLLLPGDAVAISTSDSSTGGSAMYFLGCKITQFNA